MPGTGFGSLTKTTFDTGIESIQTINTIDSAMNKTQQSKFSGRKKMSISSKLSKEKIQNLRGSYFVDTRTMGYFED